ncbi:FAD-binding monooxygenase [Exophiala viscosa]|uniref:FAD-binding monooxygenase n=1 Tax=Exophiala viscosa TaxID=2486360 RepID=A0AAN6DUX1_9EURO|nr:FAD-binding monooxygenase [Exophiala viscosa]
MGSYQPTTTVAIVGGGPAGLAAAIALSELPFLSVTIYERNPEPREVGAGISLSYNAWKVLDLLDAADGVWGSSKADTLQRNGYNGDVVLKQPWPENAKEDKRGAIRARRTRLQSGLLAKIPEGVIEFNKKLVTVEDLGENGALLQFEDGSEAVADLVVAAEGIRSVVRRTLYPDLRIHFTGNTAWRTLIPRSSLAHLPDISRGTSWWYGKGGHAYLSGVDDPSKLKPGEEELFELSVRSYHEPEIPGRTVSWGIPATNERVQSRFLEYDQRVQNAIAAVPEGNWREFANYAGPGPEKITGWDKVVLIGDASHPLHGAFGSGAAFGMEDGWTLARAIELTYNRDPSNFLRSALQIFEEIRLPYYQGMYRYLAEQREKLQTLEADNRSFDDILKARFQMFGIGQKGNLDWIYKHNIGQVWEDYLQGRKEVNA